MATLANERTVRSFILGSAALSIPFLIAACITARLGRRRWYGLDHEIIPIAFSFITITTSALLSVLYFRRAKKEESGESAPVRKSLKVLWAFLDLANSFCYLGVLIPTWILEPRRLSTGAMMVETYATCFLIVNMIAHFYLGFYSFGTALKSCCFFPSECPNCHHSLRSSEPQMARPRNEREGYSLLRGEIYLDEDEDAAPIEQPSVSAEAPTDNAEAEVGNVSPKPALNV